MHKHTALVYFTDMEWVGERAEINADCVVPVENVEEAKERMLEDIALVQVQQDPTETVPRKKAKTIKD